MRAFLAALVTALAIASPVVAGDKGDAEVITHSESNAPGVSTSARRYADPARDIQSSGRGSSVPASVAEVSGVGPRPNMCTGLVRGAEFVAYNDSPVCAS